MHALPESYPFRSFVGYTVVSVVEGAHFVEVSLALDERRARVQFEGPGAVVSAAGVRRAFDNAELGANAGLFRHLVRAEIVDVHRASSPGLEFEFSDGTLIELFDNVGSF